MAGREGAIPAGCGVGSVLLSSARGGDVYWVDLDRRCPCLLGPDWWTGTVSWQKGPLPSITRTGVPVCSPELPVGREVLSDLTCGEALRGMLVPSDFLEAGEAPAEAPEAAYRGAPSSPRKPPQAPEISGCAALQPNAPAPGRELPPPCPASALHRQPAWSMSPGTETIQCQKQGSDSVGGARGHSDETRCMRLAQPGGKPRQGQEEGRAAGLSQHRYKTLKKIRRTGFGSE